MTTKATCYPKRNNCDIICPNDYLFDNPPLCSTNSNINIECYPAYLKCTEDKRSQTSLERNNDPENILLKMNMWGKQASAQAIAVAKQGNLINPSTQAITIAKQGNLINPSTQANSIKISEQKNNYTIVIIIIIIIITALAYKIKLKK